MSRSVRVVASTLSFLAAAAAAVAQQPPTPLTLGAAVEEAIAHNPALAAERANVPAAQAAITTAGLRPNPLATIGVLKPAASLVDAGLSPTDTSARLDVPVERGGKRERRVEEATKYIPVENLAVSPQCGFASTEEGNVLTEEEQWAKLAMIVELAAEVWK